ncbi:hypothetical protein PoB_001814600 [Plakobranchus ocellatus]|uniref:Uncharacterized protein n=1 Tax=Plakobranchus ocellatus TaxID=259542 RepID=A0AAV3YX13_9GAST|nr:hypothetical protein PoB_001814600 [Plakobranchus ocellatus]
MNPPGRNAHVGVQELPLPPGNNVSASREAIELNGLLPRKAGTCQMKSSVVGLIFMTFAPPQVEENRLGRIREASKEISKHFFVLLYPLCCKIQAYLP